MEEHVLIFKRVIHADVHHYTPAPIANIVIFFEYLLYFELKSRIFFLQVSNCAVNQCRNGGTCFLDASGRAQCRCTPSFIGNFCEIVNPCFISPCLNGGTCTPLGANSYLCSCRSPFFGQNCQF
jgi:hypothetical protein